MSLTVDLPQELAADLTAEASRLGLSLPEYALRLLGGPRNSGAPLNSGIDLVDYWRNQGILGTRADVPDSQLEARQLRELAQRRGA
jgi:hypothetical protein